MKILRVHGYTYEPELDQQRLKTLHLRIKAYMLQHGEFRTHEEIAEELELSPHTDIGRRLRDCRAPENGYHWMESRRRTDEVWEYRLHPAGTGDNNREGALQVRLKRAEQEARAMRAWAIDLCDALAELDPEHPLVEKWDRLN